MIILVNLIYFKFLSKWIFLEKKLPDAHGFGPLIFLVVGAFELFSLLDEVNVDIWGNKLDALFKIFTAFSNGSVCSACRTRKCSKRADYLSEKRKSLPRDPVTGLFL